MTKTKLTHQTSTGYVDTRTTARDYEYVVEITAPTRPDKRKYYELYDAAAPKYTGKQELTPEHREERVHQMYRSAVREYDRYREAYGDHTVVLSWHSRMDLAVKAAEKAMGWAEREGRVATAVPIKPEASKLKATGGLTKNQLAILTYLASKKQAVYSIDVQTETGLSGMQVGGVVPSLVQRKLVTRGSEDGSLVITREGKEALA